MQPDSPATIAIDYDAPAKLMKWPSLKGERISVRDGANPYTIVGATLANCIRRLAAKPESQRHLYEIHTSPQPAFDLGILPASEALTISERKDFPPE
jgi:hypothetical protein